MCSSADSGQCADKSLMVVLIHATPLFQDARGVLASLDTPSSQQDLALRERVLTQVGRPPFHEGIITAVT